MDTINKNILRLLMGNPKMPFLKIAEKIGVSPITVQKRFEKMRKEGTFYGTTLIVDLSRIGFQGKAFLFITTRNSDVKKIVGSLNQIPNLFLVVEIVGGFDLLAMVVFRKLSEVVKVVNCVKAVSSVEKVELALSEESFYPYREEYGEIELFEPENTKIL